MDEGFSAAVLAQVARRSSLWHYVNRNSRTRVVAPRETVLAKQYHRHLDVVGREHGLTYRKRVSVQRGGFQTCVCTSTLNFSVSFKIAFFPMILML